MPVKATKKKRARARYPQNSLEELFDSLGELDAIELDPQNRLPALQLALSTDPDTRTRYWGLGSPHALDVLEARTHLRLDAIEQYLQDLYRARRKR
jgi:hypothetical protein